MLGIWWLDFKIPGAKHEAAVYDPKAFIPHAASLRQAFAHCARFLAAASRRSRARVAVPLLGNTLSYPLPVIVLVSHYLTNKLIGRRPILERFAPLPASGTMGNYLRFHEAMPLSRVCIYVLLTHSPLSR